MTFPLFPFPSVYFPWCLSSFCLLRMKKRRVLWVFQSLRSTGPANVERSSKCLQKCDLFLIYVLAFSPHVQLTWRCSCRNNSLCLSSAFKACHPKVKSFYFAADGVDDMNRWGSESWTQMTVMQWDRIVAGWQSASCYVTSQCFNCFKLVLMKQRLSFRLFKL